MFLIMGITGKVGGATARHLLARAKRCERCPRPGGGKWADRGVELVHGDWNDARPSRRRSKVLRRVCYVAGRMDTLA